MAAVQNLYNPEKNLWKQRREPKNSTHKLQRIWESIPGHSGGKRVLSPLRHPCFFVSYTQNR